MITHLLTIHPISFTPHMDHTVVNENVYNLDRKDGLNPLPFISKTVIIGENSNNNNLIITKTITMTKMTIMTYLLLLLPHLVSVHDHRNDEGIIKFPLIRSILLTIPA